MEGRQRSRKIVMLRMGSQVTDKTLEILQREMRIAARTGDTSVVLDMQVLRTADEAGIRLFHQTISEAIPPKRVVLFNVGSEIFRLLEDLALKDEYDQVMQRTDTQAAMNEPAPAAAPPPVPPRPPTAPVTRPPTGQVPRPVTGQVPRPVTGQIPRPPTGQIPRPPTGQTPRPATGMHPVPEQPPRKPTGSFPAPVHSPRPPTGTHPVPGAANANLPPSARKPKPPGVDPAELAGKTFLGLQIGDEIGRGGLATVYIARQPNTGQDYALKVLHPWYSTSKNIVDQFLAEGNLGKRLEHENLVKVYGCGRQGKLYYVLLEYVPSMSVLELINEVGRVPEPRSLQIIVDVATAIEYLEKNSVIHGDVKPGNILVTDDGHARLCDFGQAKQVDLDPDQLTLQSFGTPSYTAPERNHGDHSSDPRGEIYSLGVTLYRMVAGIKPGFSGKIPLHPLHPQFLSDNMISATTRYFIARMTVLDVNLRYGSATELLKEMKKHLIGGREYKRDMTMFGEEYVNAYRSYMQEHGKARPPQKPTEGGAE